ncbi:MAG: hypothetical protein KF785_10805 [Gemmatimonadales bacterium]|nr:hypothetical protein [Gemmatimonadales bacterium]
MRRGWLGLAAAALLLAGCGDSTPPVTPPTPGTLTVSYQGTGASDGAMLLVVTGAVTSVEPVGGYRVASAPISGGAETRIVVTGDLVPGDLVRLAVPDISKADDYAANVEAVAHRATYALQDPLTYTASIRR